MEKEKGITIKIPKVNPWLITTIILVVILAVFYFKGGITGKVIQTTQGQLTAQEAGDKAVEYINKYLLRGRGSATLLSASEENGLFALKLEIGGRTYNSYVTMDGKLLFPSAIDLTQIPQTPTQTQQRVKKNCSSLKKEDKPLLQAFVVSYCPFGLQMQRILSEIVQNIPQLEDYIKVRYIGSISNGKITSMHGDKEAQENLRQICIREEQPDKYWDYIACHIKKGDVDPCLSKAGVDKTKLETCMNDTNRGLKYAQEDFNLQDKFGVTGSPTLILNDERVSEFDFGGRTAQAVKTVLCCGFNEMPDFCSQNLTTAQANTGFSESYSSGSSGSSGQC